MCIIKTYCDVVSHKLWGFIICGVYNDVERDMGGAVFAVCDTEHQVVSCWLHPLMSGLHIVDMTLHDVLV